MNGIGRWTDPRTPAQQRTGAWLPLLAPALIFACLWVRLLFYQPLGEPWASVLALLITVGPLAALYRFGVDARPWRAAALEGVGAAALVAFVYWFAFIRPAITPWWE